jgi:lysophospholipase L1-like esterase
MRSLIRLLALTLAWPAIVLAEDALLSGPAGRWESDFATFELADRQSPPAPGGVVFVGSSSIRRWDGLEQRFGDDTPIVKRGFGGSTLRDCAQYVQRLVTRYRPRLVVVYAGDNDLAEGRSPHEVLVSFTEFVAGVRRELPTTRIAFVSIKPSPLRSALLPQVRQANALVREFARKAIDVDYIDVFTPMLGPDGQPRIELFVDDALHLNAAGYGLWEEIIGSYLR